MPSSPERAFVEPLHVRWLGSVDYNDALALQHGLFARSAANHLLLLEHPHVYTLGVRADRANVLVDPADVGAQLVIADRGGDVTYHGPGQLVGYPVLWVPGKRGGGMADTVAYVRSVEQLVIDALGDLGLRDVGRLRDFPGVWVEPESDHPRKIAAIGVRLSRGRSMHGFALNVDPDMRYFDWIVPCGIQGKAVTSLAREGIGASMHEVVDVIVDRATARWGGSTISRADVAWRVRPEDLSVFSRGGGAGEVVGRSSGETNVRLRGRLVEAGVGSGLDLRERKPEWMRVKVNFGDEYRRLNSIMHGLELNTVCQEAGCPNIYECWNDGTATFMINGDRCTRACGFCLIPDCQGDADALDLIFRSRPDVLNHNIETVARLQRAVRPSASYARSLSVLARAEAADLTTKSSIIVGMGETIDEVIECMADLRAVGVDIVTIGQYLRPTSNHVPVARWLTPDEFARLAYIGEQELGIPHVEASPLTRSSYHAKSAAARSGER
jgi:lipoyl synthase